MQLFRVPRRRTMALATTAVAALAAAALVMPSGTAAAQPGPSHQGFTPPKIGHVWTIILENKSYEATYQNVQPGFAAPDDQTFAATGCVYPKRVQTIFDQLDQVNTSWTVYAQDMGNDPAREQVYHCGIPGAPSGAGVPDPGGAEAIDQYVPKHNPAPWFHSLTTTRRTARTSSRWTASTPPRATPRSRRSRRT